jgi:hypothetical protein
MPKSKHRRGGRNRPREYATHAPERKPEPSPPWVPVTGGVLVTLGVLTVLLGYLPFMADLTRSLPVLGANWSLVGGFALMIVGFGFLMRGR